MTGDWVSNTTFKIVDKQTNPKAILMDWNPGVVRAFRVITIDEIKPGMVLYDRNTDQERTVAAVSTTVKADDTPKSVRIKFEDGKYAGLSYGTTTEYRTHGSHDYRGYAVEVPSARQARFKEAYDLNVTVTVQSLASKMAADLLEKHIEEYHPETPLPASPYDLPSKKKRRWFR